MKLQTRFLLVPITAAVLMLALGAGASLALRNDDQAMVAIHQQAEVAAVLQRARANAAETNAQVYRLITIIGNLDEAKIKAQRDQIKERHAQVVERLAVVSRSEDPEIVKSTTELRRMLDKAFKVADDAIDLASVDANTGISAMQTADQEFTAAAKLAHDLGMEAQETSARRLAAAEELANQAQIAIWALSGLAIVATMLMSTVFSRRVVRAVGEARGAALRVAQGDLSGQVAHDADGELGELQKALGEMQQSLRKIVSEVRHSAESIATASAQIATGNNDLSGRTESQASSLEETASSMEQLTQTVRSNADSARQANQLALSASEVAERGGSVVNEVVQTMESITESSRRIAEIIGVIDGIAFQTNILALNAAVEAARAGEQGRGFAVVAGEVRSLAQRSADAAKEIKGLITASVTEVEAGSKLVRGAGSTMVEIVSSVKRVTDIIGEISAATGEQSGQIGQVNSAVGQLDQMTQQNAALVEQSAAAAESLREQAGNLGKAVSVFRTDDRAGHEPAHSMTPVTSDHGGVTAKISPMPAAVAPAAPRRSSAPKAVRSTPVRAASPAAPAPAPLVSRAADPAPAEPRRPSKPADTGGSPANASASPSPRMPVNEDDWETF